MVVKLYPHQQEAVDKLANGKILWGGVGVGKSLTAIAYFVSKVCKGTYNDWGSMREPRDIYIITTAKKRDSGDWEKDANAFGIGKDREASIGNILLTVDSWNNIGRYTEVKDAFFIFDEQRLVGSGTWTKAFIKIAKRNGWILLSATPGDTWLDYIPVFVANGFYKNRTEFKDTHVVYNTYSKFPKVDRYIGAGTLVRHRNDILVHMPYQRHTTRHIQKVNVDYDVELFNKVVEKRWHVYDERPLRDVAELFGVMRKVVNSDSSRMEALRTLMTKHPKLIVFYNFNYELEMLRTLIPEGQLASPESIQQLAERINSTRLDRTSATSSSMRSSTSKNSSDRTALRSSPSESPTPLEDLITGGHWTQDEGDGEMWIPLSTKSQYESSTSMPTPTSLSSAPSLTTSTRSSQTESESTTACGTTCPNLLRTESEACLTRTEESTRPNWTCQSPLAKETDTAAPLENGLDQLQSPSLDANVSYATQETFSVAEWNGQKHEEIPKTDRWVYLVQYAAGAEGWNCIETDAMVFFSLTYSYKMWHQAYGRIDRLNTPFSDLYYYVLMSDSLIDKAVWKSLKTKKSFNEANSGIKLP